MITFVQLLLAVSIPTIVGLVGLVLGQVGYHRLDDKIGRLDDKFDRKIDGLATQLHSDMMMIESVLRDHGERLAKMEPR